MRIDIFLIKKINEIIKTSNRIVLYPYGANSKIIERYLGECGFQGVVLCADNFKANNKNIFTLDKLLMDEYSDFKIIITSGDIAIWKSLRRKLENVEKARIIDLYPEPDEKSGIAPVDAIRASALEMAVSEIYFKDVPGNVAEAGVFKGDFSRLINYYMPDRKLYMIDTFEGFDMRDLDIEKKYTDTKAGGYRFDDINYILDSMVYEKQCIIKKGYVPDVLDGIDDTFAFVSLDMDLYKPIYSGLKWFYPRLEKGGYIFIHDCRNFHFWGARQALLDFCNENNVGYVMLPDGCGTAIITK